jgi:hypothetical protein
MVIYYQKMQINNQMHTTRFAFHLEIENDERKRGYGKNGS